MTNNAYFLIGVLCLAFIALGTSTCWRYMRDLFSSRPPPVIDAQGDDVKERLNRAFAQQHEASAELQAVVKNVLAENDRLRRHHERGGHA